MTPKDKAKRTLLGIEIPRDELTCRIAEKAIGLRRPAGTSASEALAQLKRAEPETAQSFYAIADAVVSYFHECINAARQPS